MLGNINALACVNSGRPLAASASLVKLCQARRKGDQRSAAARRSEFGKSKGIYVLCAVQLRCNTCNSRCARSLLLLAQCSIGAWSCRCLLLDCRVRAANEASEAALAGRRPAHASIAPRAAPYPSYCSSHSSSQQAAEVKHGALSCYFRCLMCL